MTTARRRRRARAVLLPLAVLLAVGACGGDDEPDEDPPDTTAATPTTSPATTAPSPEAEVEEAYLAYWEMAARLSAAPNPDDPEIAERAVDPVLGVITDSLSTLRAQGQEVHLGDQYARDVTSVVVNGDEAVVRDCTIDDGERRDGSSQEVIDRYLNTVLLEATLVSVEGRWLVREIDQLNSWDGAVACEG